MRDPSPRTMQQRSSTVFRRYACVLAWLKSHDQDDCQDRNRKTRLQKRFLWLLHSLMPIKPSRESLSSYFDSMLIEYLSTVTGPRTILVLVKIARPMQTITMIYQRSNPSLANSYLVLYFLTIARRFSVC